MRRALAALLLVLACAPLHAQRGLEGRQTGAGSERSSSSQPASQPVTPAPSSPRGMGDEVRSPTPQGATRPQEQRARELPRAQPALRDETRRSDIYPRQTTAPSPAQQMQQGEFERQQLQRQHAAPAQQAAPGQQAAPPDRGSARCSAFPVCVRQPGRYGSCQGVEQVYASAHAGHRDIVSRCRRANNPDTCDCAAQCSQVAQCSIF